MASMHRLLLGALAAFLLCALGGYPLLLLLRRMGLKQSERAEGPASHLKKAGTPTMGGLMLLLGWMGGGLLSASGSYGLLLPTLLILVLCGLMGFLDDFIKVRTGTSMGLLPYQKVMLQFVISLLAAAWLYRSPLVGTGIELPFSHRQWELGFLYIPFAVFVLMGTMNAVNLTDGLDGLAAGTGLIVQVAFVILFSLLQRQQAPEPLSNHLGNMAVFSAAGAGALMGFLLYNAYPAKVFMGDTGSLALGGAIAMQALVSRSPLLLPLMGVCFVVSALSVILQVGSYKLRHGKRVFKMAPLHHHFELLGVEEPKITAWYMLLTGVFCALSLYIFTN